MLEPLNINITHSNIKHQRENKSNLDINFEYEIDKYLKESQLQVKTYNEGFYSTINEDLQKLKTISSKIEQVDLLSSLSSLISTPNSTNFENVGYLCLDDQQKNCVSIIPIPCQRNKNFTLSITEKVLDKNKLFYSILNQYSYVMQSLFNIRKSLITNYQKFLFNNILQSLNSNLTSNLPNIKVQLEFLKNHYVCNWTKCFGSDSCSENQKETFNKIYNAMINFADVNSNIEPFDNILHIDKLYI
jgi:hypothetical protein